MRKLVLARTAVPRGVVSIVLGLLAGCAACPRPLDYQALDSARQLAPNSHDKGKHLPFYYSVADADWGSYRKVWLDPVTVYQGSDQQFGKLAMDDRRKLAAYAQAQFSQALAGKYGLASAPGADTLRVHVTLTGASRTTLVLSTVKQVMPVGAVMGTVKSAADKPSKFLGSVTYAVEIYDSQTQRLLRAFVAVQYPAAENIAASLGGLAAAETGLRKGAKALPTQLK